MLCYRYKGKEGGVWRLRYDNISGFIVDGCRLAHALFSKQNVHDYARLGERPNLVGVLNHHVVEREWLAIGELGCNLLGKRLVKLGRLARRLGLGGVFLENVELVGNLAGKVLGRMLLGVIVVPERGLDDLGRDLARHAHESSEHLVVGELKLGASGSHELTPIRPRDASEPPFGSFFLCPLWTTITLLLHRLFGKNYFKKYGGIMETPGR